MPKPKISLKDFKSLLARRSRALSRLNYTSNPSPNSNPNPEQVEHSEEAVPERGSSEEGINDQKVLVKPVDGPQISPALLPDNIPNSVDSLDQTPTAPLNPTSETINKQDASNDKEKRKREVEEKLQILKGRKHNLVQVLKQILTAEEELKRRNTMQGLAVHPNVPLQVDVTNDSGSMTRHVTPQMGSDGNIGGNMEGGEADDVSNNNMHSRHLHRMSSTSPSSDSPHRRSAFNVVPHTSRATLGIGSSPSRFAPIGQQGHTANLPAVSVSGTNYIASSPSPAASGGTSVFRDGRLPSPWN